MADANNKQFEKMKVENFDVHLWHEYQMKIGWKYCIPIN